MIVVERTERVCTPFGPLPAEQLRAGDPVLAGDGTPIQLKGAAPIELAELMPVLLRNTRSASSSTVWLTPDQKLPVCRQWANHLLNDWEAGGRYVRRADELGIKRKDDTQPVGRPQYIGAEPPGSADPYALGLYLANVRRDGSLRVWTKALPWFLRRLPEPTLVQTRGIWSTLRAPALDGLTIGAWSSIASPEERQACLDGLADGCRTSEMNLQLRFGSVGVRLNRASDAIGARRLVLDSGLVPSLKELPTKEDNPRHAGKPIYEVSWTPKVPTGQMPQLSNRGLGSKRSPDASSWKLIPGPERELRPAVQLELDEPELGLMVGSGNLTLNG